MQTKFKLILLTGLYPKTNIESIINNSKHGVESAADTLQWNLVNGFCEVLGEKSFDIINFPYIGNYPRHYKKMWYKPSIENSTIIKDNKFCNLILYKNFDICNKAYKSICNLIKDKDVKYIIIIYAINDAFIKAAIKAKLKYKNISICLIVPDLLEGMIENLDWIHSIVLNNSIKNLKKQLPFIDKYVFLSEHMKECFDVSDKDYIVMEGIYDINKLSHDIPVRQSTNREIVYSGNLAERYGVLNLARAFTQITEPDLRLVICGIGGAFDELQKMSKIDNRIILKGFIPHKEVLKIQMNAFLLVNPRTSEGEFTKYSFPSKTMEYLGSGTPTLLYKLDGIPDEYYNYCYAIERWNGVDELYRALNDVINKPKVELEEKGISAKRFIIENKNPFIQCSRIIDFLNRT